MSQVILYSNHCPQCMLLSKRLKEKGINYIEVNDVDLMMSKGFMSMPMLEVNNDVLKFADALQWVNKQ